MNKKECHIYHFKEFLKLFLLVYMLLYSVGLSTCDFRYSWIPWGWSHQTWVLRTKLWSFVSAIYAINCWAISLTPHLSFWKLVTSAISVKILVVLFDKLSLENVNHSKDLTGICLDELYKIVTKDFFLNNSYRVLSLPLLKSMPLKNWDKSKISQ